MLDDLINVSPKSTNLMPERVDLKAFFHEIATEFPEVAIEIADEGVGHHTFDRLKMKRVIINIVKNAIEATHGKGSYWIEAKNEDNGLQIEIGNLGSKIEREQLTKIFELFFTAGKAAGRGLGMAIAKKFTEEHSGEIWCESNGWSSKDGTVTRRQDSDYVVFNIRLP